MVSHLVKINDIVRMHRKLVSGLLLCDSASYVIDDSSKNLRVLEIRLVRHFLRFVMRVNTDIAKALPLSKKRFVIKDDLLKNKNLPPLNKRTF
jgi:hypothetical protein